jgi:hypothetical protein
LVRAIEREIGHAEHGACASLVVRRSDAAVSDLRPTQ